MVESVVGPWAKDKLERLRKYLTAYTKIMAGQKARRFKGFYYIDAFAGPGIHQLRSESPAARRTPEAELLEIARHSAEDEDQKQFLAGSPRVALDLPIPFTHYFFVEYSPERAYSLEELKKEFGNARSIHIRREDCTKYLRERVAGNRTINWDFHRAIVFLDPFGMQVGWETIEQLANKKGIEIFLNFPVGMAIQRLLPRDPSKITAVRKKNARWLFRRYRLETSPLQARTYVVRRYGEEN